MCEDASAISKNLAPSTDLEKLAGELYTRLKTYADLTNGYTTLEGFHHAFTYFPNRESVLEIREIHPSEDDEVNPLLRYGFTQKQIALGITTLDSYKMISPDPSHPFSKLSFDRGNIRRTYIASVGSDNVQVIEVNDGQPNKRQLETDEALALGTSGDLVQIMTEISSRFEDVSQFQTAVIKAKPMADVYSGIEYVDTRGLMLFKGGLTMFVNEYRKLMTGQTATDSTSITIRN